MHPLDGPEALIKRAKHHLNVLDRNLRAFYKLEPCRITEEVNSDYVWYIRRIEMKPPPARLGVIAGDGVMNLRASLDHLAWQLALTQATSPFPRTEFPIIKDWNTESERRFRTVLQDVPPPAVDLIQAFQPYHSGKAAPEHGLWLLDQLCNIAKHVVIPVHGVFIDMKIPRDERIKPWMFDDGAVVLLIPINLKPQVDLAPKPAGGVTFGYQGRVTVDPRQLGAIYHFVAEDMLPLFARFFPKR